MYQTKSKRCLGIDPGLENCGYALIGRKHATEQFNLFESGCIQTDRKAPYAERLLKIYQDISELLHAHTPNLVAIEKVYFNQNVSSAISTGGAIGVCLLSAEQLGIKSLLLTPQQAKAAATGNGRASKETMKKVLNRHLGQTIDNHHATDAAALAIAGLLHLASVHS